MGCASPRLRLQRWGFDPEEVPDDALPPRTNPDENFSRALRGGAELIALGSEDAECVRAIEAAYRSARTGRTVKVRDSDSRGGRTA